MSTFAAAFAAIVIVCWPVHAFAAGLRSPEFKVEVDISAAEAIFTAATIDPANAAAAADAALKLPAVTELIAKEHKYNSKACVDTFKSDVVAVASGASGQIFPLQRLRNNPSPARQMLDSLSRERKAIGERLGRGLQAFTPDGVVIRASLVIVLGSNQGGWVPDQRSTTVYVEASRHFGDVDGLVATAAHELFHVVQGSVQPGWGPVFSEPPKTLSAEERERRRVHAVFTNLVIEGMATYVGDPNAWNATHAGFDHDAREYARELARSQETFALFDTIVYRISRDDSAPLDPLLTVGFGGSWEQTGYYVGYSIAKAIDRYAGRDRLRALVTLTPEEFISDYISVAKAHPEDREITPLAESTGTALLPGARH